MDKIMIKALIAWYVSGQIKITYGWHSLFY